MRVTQYIDTVLSGTAVAGRLDELLRLYDDAENAMSSWKLASGVSCADGCGACCERYLPDILPVEADLIAAYLLSERPDLLPRRPVPGRSFCPLYLAETKEHCPVYPVRPLTCRLFGFTSVADKTGMPVYKPCREMPERVVRLYGGRDGGNPPGGIPPAMGEFGYRLVSVDAHLAGERRPLPEALEDSLRKIRHLSSLADPDGSGPEITAA